VADGRLAALAEAPDALAGSLAGATPAQVLVLQLAQTHARPADDGEADGPGPQSEIDLQRPPRDA
jgi:hypothetical protein